MRWDLTLVGLILVVGLLLQPTAAQDYELSFDIKGYWYSTTAKIEIYVEDKLIKTFRATDFPRSGGKAPPVDPMHVVVNLGDAYGKRVKIRYVSLAGGGWILLDNVTVTKNGSQVRFAPWIINKNPPDTGIEAKKVFGREKRLVFIEVDKRKSKDYAEFISQPLVDAPELEIKPSYIKFSPETPYDSPTSVKITAKVRNVGSSDAESVRLELWINDKKVSESDVFSVPAGGEIVRELGVYNYKDGVVKVEVRVVSSDDVLKENNRAVRFLIPAHPYILFSDVSQVPIAKYGDVEPYKSWRKFLIGRANSYLDDDLTYASYKGRKVLALAFAYLLTDDERYAKKAVEALLTAGKEVESKTVYGGKKHVYVKTTKNALYYALAFDFLRGYIYKINKTQYYLIEKRLAEIAKDIKWKVYIYHVYNFKESLPRGGNSADPNNNMLVENPILVVVMSALLGYNGELLDYLNPYQSIRDAMKNLFFESITGAPYPAAMVVHLPGGFTYQGLYRGQYAKYLAIGVMTYHKLFGDDLINDLAKGIFDQPVWHADPTGGEPNNKGLRSGGVAWHEQWIVVDLYEGQDKLNHQWYINHVIMKRGLQKAGFFGDVEKAIFPGIFYDYTLPESEPKWNGTYSYFSKANAKAIFRNGRDGQELWLKLYGHNHPIWSSATTSRTYHGAYSIWAKGAYLVVDRGDERGWRGTDVRKEGGFGFSSFIFNGTLVPARWNQFGRLENPSLLTDYFISEEVESATVFTKIKKFRDVESGKEFYQPEIKWNRTVIFPKNYFVILDEVRADKPYEFYMTIQYGGTEADTSKQPLVNYPVKGVLKIDGKVIDWWNREPFEAVTNFVSWATESLTKVTSRVPLYTTTHWVELDTFIAPACEITYDLSGMQYGSRKNLDHLWHPFIKVKQVGKEVRYITVHYPRDLSKNESSPSFRELKVSGNGYAVEVKTDEYRDLIHISDGNLIRYEGISTDAKISFARFNAETNSLSYVYLKNFSRYSFNSKDLISGACRIEEALLKYEEGKVTLSVEGNCDVTVWIDSTSGVEVRKDGMVFANWEVLDGNYVKISGVGKSTYEILYSSVDRNPPTTSYELSSKPSKFGIFNSTVVVTFYRNDDSGVAYTNYSFDRNSWVKVSGDSPFEVTVEKEGTTTIWYYSVDVNGNAENVKSLTISIDKTPPAVKDLKVNTNSSVIVEILLSEPAKVVAEFNNKTIVSENYADHHIFKFGPSNSGVLTFIAEDKAGNTAKFEKSIAFKQNNSVYFNVNAPSRVYQGDKLTITVTTNAAGKLTIAFPPEWKVNPIARNISGNYTAEVTVPKISGDFAIQVVFECLNAKFNRTLKVKVVSVTEPWQKYDANGDGQIDYFELMKAVKDWTSKRITDKEFVNVLLKFSKRI